MVGGETLLITLTTGTLGYVSQSKKLENLCMYISHNALIVRNIY